MKQSKYRNKKTEVDGILFDSLKESRRYGQLKLLERQGLIGNLRLQVKYPLIVQGVKIGSYVADFVYQEGPKEKVEDVKGVKTPVYNLKKKLMKAIHGIEIQEV